ncbi:MAG: YhbY family RNA-binding protein [Clostridia bacterium]|nr:YhbY family RNA-binding protein [Clostridia bacterium]
MLTSKQRSNLRSLANGIKPVTQVGKNGVNDTLIICISDALEAHELVKITVLENSMLTPKEVGFEIAEKCGAEFVCATGRKLVFYRRSKKDGIKHVEF